MAARQLESRSSAVALVAPPQSPAFRFPSHSLPRISCSQSERTEQLVTMSVQLERHAAEQAEAEVVEVEDFQVRCWAEPRHRPLREGTSDTVDLRVALLPPLSSHWRRWRRWASTRETSRRPATPVRAAHPRPSLAAMLMPLDCGAEQAAPSYCRLPHLRGDADEYQEGACRWGVPHSLQQS